MEDQVKSSLLVLFLYLSVANLGNSQVIEPTRFPLQEYNRNNNEAFLIGLPNNDLVMFWYDSTLYQIKYARSIDGGNYWINPDSLVNIVPSESYIDINGAVMPSGRVIITFRSTFYYYIYSDDNCNTWSAPATLPTRSGILARRKVFQSSLAVTSNGNVNFVHSYSQLFSHEDASGIFNISSQDGINWSIVDTIDLAGKQGQIINVDLSKDILVYSDSTQNSYDLFYRISNDSGISWGERSLLVENNLSKSKPRGVKDQNGTIWIYYVQEEETPFSEMIQTDINYINSTDLGNTWSIAQNFTKYIGYDFKHNVTLWNGRPLITFISSRDFSSISWPFQIYLTLADVVIDTNAPPFLYNYTHTIEAPYPNQPYFIRAFVDDDREIVSVKLNTYFNPPGVYNILEMFDDGVHNDSLANDKIYGNEITLQNYGDFASYSFIIEDNDFNTKFFYGGGISVPTEYAIETYLIDVNNFNFPLDSRGVLADASINGVRGGIFDEIVALYSGGFFLSGSNNGTPWVNAIASSSLVTDYQSGKLGSSPLDPVNKLYTVKNSDQPFGTSWQEYQLAVEQGADFYDGNNDGIYNPVDLNGNNIWDDDEDRPDFLGDVSVWCVYNDGTPGSQRRWNDQQPMGIEIQQTVFAWGENVNDLIDNMIFVRYRIFNKGTVSSNFNNVYFSAWADPDIGGSDGSGDDLAACDTLLQLGYMYNSGSDPSYGINPPAFGISFLQGPTVYIPGQTFIDNNSNGIYDDLIDTPLDTAYLNNGPILGVSQLPGAKNQESSSFISYINNDPNLNDPNTGSEAINYMLGLNKIGNIPDPCSWAYGIVTGGVNCTMVDPKYWYSGNRLANGGGGSGWLNSYSADQRILFNNGPFNLEQDKPIDIIVGYLIGRGTNDLNSISILKSVTEEAIQIYNSNFTDIPTAIENVQLKIENFELFQNYPNPFNPITTIKYSIPSSVISTEGRNLNVSLKIYDVLGNEVAKLVNEEKSAGSYEVKFNASSLSSGVYFYTLRTGSFVQTNKMILIK